MEKAPELCENCERALRTAAKRLLARDGQYPDHDVVQLLIPESAKIPMALLILSGDGRDIDFGEACLAQIDA